MVDAALAKPPARVPKRSAPGVTDVYPKSVRGPVRRAKWIVLGLLLAIYYGVPWLRWDRGPFAPNQAVLIDLPGGRGYFLWFEIWPQEVYVVTGILIMMAVGLFLVTAVAGRVWCGFACPQTVWTDLFMLVERLIEGDRVQRMRLAAAPLGPAKAARLAAKHLIWLAIAALTGGAWVLYFNDAPTLVRGIFEGRISPGVLATVGLLTFTTYLLAGWAREAVCTFMCPYARFQSAMMDSDTLVVAYRAHRGEPRGKHKAGDDWTGRGDCIDCHQCVEVCPTGIDIREGLQMTCIACGLCTDACDGIMTRMGRPTRLIAWDTQRNLDAAAAGSAAPVRWFRLRTVAYAMVYAAAGLALLSVLVMRSPLEASLLPDRNPLYVRLSDGAIRNAFTIKILNKTNDEHAVTVRVEGLPGAVLAIGGQSPIHLKPDTVTPVRVFVSIPAKAWTGQALGLSIVLEDPDRRLNVALPAKFEGPTQ